MAFISHKPDRTWIYQISLFLLKSVRIRLKKFKFSASRRIYQYLRNSGSSFIIFTGLLISTVPTTARAKEKNHNNIKNLQQNKIEKTQQKPKLIAKQKNLQQKQKLKTKGKTHKK